MKRPSVLVLLVGLAACSDRVVSGAENFEGPTQLRLEPTPQVSFGGLDERPEYSFSVVSDGAFLAANKFVILDSQNRDFKVYSTAGEHLRTFGRQGDGPGEIGRLPTLLISSDGAVRMWDGLQQRLTVFNDQGEHLESLRPLEGVDIRFAEVAGAFSDNQVVWKQPSQSRGADEAPTGEYRDTTFHVVRAVDGATDTLAWTLAPELFRTVVGGQSLSTRVLFGREGFAVIGGDRLIYGVTDEPLLRSKNQDGSEGPSFRWEAEREPVSAQEIDSLRRQSEAPWRMRQKSGGPQLVEFATAQLSAIESGPARETRPHFSVVHVNGEGGVLVQPATDLFARTDEWVMFDRDGTLLGQFSTPREFRVLDFTRDRILGYTLDNLDLPTVQIRTLTGG